MNKSILLHYNLKVPEDFGQDPHPHPDPDELVRGTDPRIWIRIRIRTKMPRIPNTAVQSTTDFLY
jgi:hypothetical protein